MIKVGIIASMAVFVNLTVPAMAASLYDDLGSLVTNHQRLVAAQADVDAASERVEVAKGSWYPDLSMSTSYGYERQIKGNDTADTSMPSRDLSASINQTVWDFGAINAEIERANLELEQSKLTLSAGRQSLILEGVSAYIELARASKLVQFAIESVKNIKHQADLEDSKVQRGSGLPTDVLHAKTQLAGAEARLTRARGAFRVASNRYRAVFGYDAGNINDMEMPEAPLGEVPGAVDQAIAIAFKENPGLEAAATTSYIARKDVTITNANEFMPNFDLVVESSFQRDAEGTVGDKSEQLIMLELTYDFNLGGTAINTLRAAKYVHSASENRYGDEQTRVEEQIRNAWDNLETAKENAGHLTNQADIAAEFLELARQERFLGNRSLIDVLSGETALINANSESASAQADVSLAVYSLVAAMGRLELNLFQ